MADKYLEYAQQLSSDLLSFMDETGGNPIQAFTKMILEEMSEKANLDTYEECYYEIPGENGRILGQINGYGITENEETDTITVSLFYTFYESNFEGNVQNVTLEKYSNALQRMYFFYKSALKGDMLNVEPSNPVKHICDILYSQRNRITSIRFCVISNCKIPNTKIRKERKSDVLFKYIVWDINSLYINLHSTLDHEPIDIRFDDDCNYEIPFIETHQTDYNYKCLLLILPGQFLYDLYEEYGTDLMQNNVRYFLGFKKAKNPNDPNGGMLATLKDKPYMFLAYNNGLTATAQDVECKYSGNNIGSITNIRDFQIINGGQTTAAIYKAKNLHSDIDLSNVYVQVKLIVLTDNNETELPLITKYSNSQNPVKAADFSVNNSFNMQMQSLSRTIYAPDKNGNNELTIWFYERMRGQYENEMKLKDKKYIDKVYPKNQVFKKELLAKVRQAWDEMPYTVVEGDAKNYKSFNPKVEKFIPDRVYYEDTIALIILYNTLYKSQVFKDLHQARSPILAYTISYLAYVTNHELSLFKIWESQQISSNLLLLCEAIATSIFELLDSLRPGTSTLRDFAKKPDTWERIKTHTMNISLSSIQSCLKEKDEDFQRKHNDEITIEDYELMVSQGSKFWDGISSYNNSLAKNEKLFTEKECDFANMVYSSIVYNKILDDEKIILKAKSIIEKVHEKEIDIEIIKSFSKTTVDIVESDLFPKYLRIKKLSGEDWGTIETLAKLINPSYSNICRKVILSNKSKLNGNQITEICSILDEINYKYNQNY